LTRLSGFPSCFLGRFFSLHDFPPFFLFPVGRAKIFAGRNLSPFSIEPLSGRQTSFPPGLSAAQTQVRAKDLFSLVGSPPFPLKISRDSLRGNGRLFFLFAESTPPAKQTPVFFTSLPNSREWFRTFRPPLHKALPFPHALPISLVDREEPPFFP